MAFNLQGFLGALSNAGQHIQTAAAIVDQGKDAVEILSSQDEAQIEAAIAELEALLPGLRASTQAKLRGGG